MEGWIKLHRQLMNWEWYSDGVVKDVFIHLLLSANHRDIRFKGQTIKTGSVITSVKRLSEALGFSDMQIRRALKMLESTGEISKKATNRYTLVYINKYSDFQFLSESSAPEKNKQTTNCQQTDNGQTTTNNNVKNVNNEKNNIAKDNEEEIALRYENLEKLREIYPDLDWDGYDESDFDVRPTIYTGGQGVVYLSAVEEDVLIDEIWNACLFLEYIRKLANFILENDAHVKNHYQTILKWYRQDYRIN